MWLGLHRSIQQAQRIDLPRSAVHQDAAESSMELVARSVGRQGETKAESWAVWADPTLVSDAAICSFDGFTNRALQALPGDYVFEHRSSLAHLGNSHCRASTGNNPILPPT